MKKYLDLVFKMIEKSIDNLVIPVYKFTDTAEVIRRSNNSTSGLAGYVFSPCHSTIQKMINELEVGMVGVNEGSISTEMAPFGGIKESGFGREGSVLGLDDYCVTKYVCLGE